MKTNFEMLRKKAGYSQQQLASELGISRARYVNYELGRAEADYETLLKLSHLYNETINTILGDDFVDLNKVSIRFEKEEYTKLEQELSDIVLALTNKAILR